MLALAEHLDAAEPLAERHLGGVVEVEAAEHEHAVGVERLQRPAGKRSSSSSARGSTPTTSAPTVGDSFSSVQHP